jgi:N,N-dimethylformamidase
MEGVGADERIGDFGLQEGGAGGTEIDWYDPMLGSPGWARVVASTEGFSSLMLETRDNLGITMTHLGGDVNPRVRADVVYTKTRNGGAVFSTGSIAWCGSLSHNDYHNNVSIITKNVLDRFANADALP